MSTVIFVFHADRGHFNICLPLATKLREYGARCELWTNEECRAWVPAGTFDDVRVELGETNLPTIVSRYKEMVCHGDTDAEGQMHLLGDGMKNMLSHVLSLPMVPKSQGEAFGYLVPASKKGAEALRRRIAREDVGCVVFEGLWGKWARDLGLEAGRSTLGIMPTYVAPYRAAYCKDPVIDGVIGSCIVRDRPQDIDPFYGWPPDAVSFTLAGCLVGRAAECGERKRYGALLPPWEDGEIGGELQFWLDGFALPERQRTVTLISIGNANVLSAISKSAAADILTGALAASPRVLMALMFPPDSPGLREAQASGRLRYMAFVPQWAVLKHPNVRCFLSHASAGSTHEALASGTPLIPLPLFDDQYYIASRLEELYGYAGLDKGGSEGAIEYAPLSKAVLRSGGFFAAGRVASAIRLGLAVPSMTLRGLRENVVEEDGAGEVAKLIAGRAGLIQPKSSAASQNAQNAQNVQNAPQRGPR